MPCPISNGAVERRSGDLAAAARAVLCGIALLCLTGADGAAATPLRASNVDAELIDGLIDWIGGNSDYDVSLLRTAPPDVFVCDSGDDIDYEGRDLIVDPELRGLYDLVNHRIVLTEPWDPGDPRHLSTLLHELIHAVQWASKDWRCIGEPEWEAHKLQETWLAEQGIDAGFDWLGIYLRSNCPRDIHP